jgi:hypothetical protein
LAEALLLETVLNSGLKTPKKFQPKQIGHIAYIDARLEEYNAALAKEDGDSSEKNIEKKIKNTLFKSKTPLVKKNN